MKRTNDPVRKLKEMALSWPNRMPGYGEWLTQVLAGPGALVAARELLRVEHLGPLAPSAQFSLLVAEILETCYRARRFQKHDDQGQQWRQVAKRRRNRSRRLEKELQIGTPVAQAKTAMELSKARNSSLWLHANTFAGLMFGKPHLKMPRVETVLAWHLHSPGASKERRGCRSLASCAASSIR